MLSVLEIIFYCLIGLAVLLYGFLSIRKAIRYKKEYKSCIDAGMTPLQAKEYCDKFFNKRKKDKEDQKDKTYEE